MPPKPHTLASTVGSVEVTASSSTVLPVLPVSVGRRHRCFFARSACAGPWVLRPSGPGPQEARRINTEPGAGTLARN